MQSIINIIIFVLYPLCVILRFIPDNVPKIIFLTIFEISMVIIGMHFFFLTFILEPFTLLIIAVAYIPLMIIFTNPSTFSFRKILFVFKYWPVKIVTEPVNNKNILLKAIEEELIWRGAFVNLAYWAGMTMPIIIPFGALLFYSVHINVKRKIYALKEFEFLFFSTFIVTAYIISNSLLITILIHFMRNSFLLCYRESTLKTELKYR